MSEPRTKKRYVHVREPSVLILREKHESRYFHVPDEATLFSVSLIILEGRLKSDYFYGDPGPAPKGPGMTLDQAKALPDGPIRDQACKSVRSHLAEVKWWEHLRNQFQSIKKAVKAKDGEEAWRLLYERSSHEYEGVEIARLRTSYS